MRHRNLGKPIISINYLVVKITISARFVAQNLYCVRCYVTNTVIRFIRMSTLIILRFNFAFANLIGFYLSANKNGHARSHILVMKKVRDENGSMQAVKKFEFFTYGLHVTTILRTLDIKQFLLVSVYLEPLFIPFFQENV